MVGSDVGIAVVLVFMQPIIYIFDNFLFPIPIRVKSFYIHKNSLRILELCNSKGNVLSTIISTLELSIYLHHINPILINLILIYYIAAYWGFWCLYMSIHGDFVTRNIILQLFSTVKAAFSESSTCLQVNIWMLS